MKQPLTKSEYAQLLKTKYQYVEYCDFSPDNGMVVTVSGYWLEQMYFPHWKSKMRKAGHTHLISLERCIQDWRVVNWAWKV